MGAPDESRNPAGRQPDMGGPRAEQEEPLPDVLELDLAELRTIQHPVLDEVLSDLRARAERPSEMLWGFNSAL